MRALIPILLALALGSAGCGARERALEAEASFCGLCEKAAPLCEARSDKEE